MTYKSKSVISAEIEAALANNTTGAITPDVLRQRLQDIVDSLAGSAILTGVGAPVAGTGFPGDYWLDTATRNLYGPKGATTWGEYVSLAGPAGPVGPPGEDGGLAGKAVINPFLRRAHTKAADVLFGAAGARLNLVMLGDSVAATPFSAIGNRLKIEFGNGGNGGRLADESGFADAGDGVNVTEITGNDFTYAPNGCYQILAAGGSKSWTPSLSSYQDPLATWFPLPGAPKITTRVGIYYTRRPGGGVFKVQRSVKGSVTTFVDVAGLTAIDTSGTLGIQYLEAAVSISNFARIRIVHVSGGDCYTVGALVGGDVGVYMHSWTRGGLSMTDFVASPRWAELAALQPADLVMTSFLDGPGDSAAGLNTGFTQTQLINGILDGVRAAFPATIVPASVAPWAAKTPAIAAEPPDYVWFAGNDAQITTYSTNGYNDAIRAYAVAHDNCFVDTQLIRGSWLQAWNHGLMGTSDGDGTSIHPQSHYYGLVETVFLKETGLIGGAYTRPIPDQTVDTLKIGREVILGDLNRDNPFKVGNANNYFSAGPADFQLIGNFVLAGVTSDDPLYGAGFVFRSTATYGQTFLAVSQPGGGFLLRDTDAGKTFFQFSPSELLTLAGASGQTLKLGSKGDALSGVAAGDAVLVAGVLTVARTNITADAKIAITRKVRGGTVGVTYEVAVNPGVGFTITSRTSADAVATSDTSTVSWIIIES